MVAHPGSRASRGLAGVIVEALEMVATRLSERSSELGRLDSVAGDGDHGIGMNVGPGLPSLRHDG